MLPPDEVRRVAARFARYMGLVCGIALMLAFLARARAASSSWPPRRHGRPVGLAGMQLTVDTEEALFLL